MEVLAEHQPGFKFNNFIRNEKLVGQGHQMPKAAKTGTTIAGVVFKDGVVLGADTRSTGGDLIADKYCSKIHFIQPNMYCCGAGTAADLSLTTQLISSQLELHRLHTGRQVPVVAANRMLSQMLFRYQGYIGAYLILGGVDKHGSHIFDIHAHGSSNPTLYTSDGSGSLAAMSVLESKWKPNMELEDAKRLVFEAVSAGITNDLGSGSNVNLCVITKDGATHFTPYQVVAAKGIRKGTYEYKRGTTDVLAMYRIPVEIVKESVQPVGPSDTSEEKMDTV